MHQYFRINIKYTLQDFRIKQRFTRQTKDSSDVFVLLETDINLTVHTRNKKK